MPDPNPVSHPLRVAALSSRRPTTFDLAPTPADRLAIARLLGISALPHLRFAGAVAPLGARDLRLEARLQATVVQPCVVTLAPVTTRIDESVTRTYRADQRPLTEDEAEMPADDSEEPLPEVIDAGAVMIEALALAMPDYPRVPGADLATVMGSDSSALAVPPPGVVPLRDADLKPLAGLGPLAARIFGTPAEPLGPRPADGGGADGGATDGGTADGGTSGGGRAGDGGLPPSVDDGNGGSD